MLVDRCRGDQILLSEAGVDETAFEMTLSAISLDAARSAGKSGARVALQASSIERVNSLSGFVATCRDGSSFIALMMARIEQLLAAYPHL
jgi:hypothetical protein